MKKMKLDIQLFNGSVSIQSGSITEITDINLNQSTFTIPAKMTTSGATYNNDNAYMTMQWKYASASSWTTISKQTFGIGKDTSKTKTWTLTLTHNPDGTLENLNFRVQWYITNSTKGTTGTTTVAPTTIPRASQPRASTSTFDLGGSIVIFTDRYSSSFTHTMFYSFGNLTNQTSGLSQSTNIGDSVNFTPPLSLATVIPNATSGTCVVTCQTYNGSTLIGTKSVSLTLTVPTNAKPTITNVTQQEVGDVPTSWNTLVQGKSRLKFTITANGAYGSTISSYITTGNGYTYTTNPATTNYITTSGSLTFNFKVIDSRGREGTGSLSRSPQPYSNPTISTAQVQRCDENGNIDNNGQYMYVSYGASISSCNGNNTSYAVYKIGYRVHNTGSYQYVPLGDNTNSKSASGILFTDGIKAVGSTGTKVEFSTNNTFDIQFYVQDYFNPNGITNIQLLDSGFDLMNFNASGKAMAIGKVSEAGANDELFEIGMNTEIDGTLDVSGNVQANSYNGTIFNLGTNNSADTWVPVMRNNYLEHRVIPTAYNNDPSSLTVGNASQSSRYRGYTTNLNDANQSGWYRWNNEASNHPWSTGWGIVEVENDGSWIFQTAYATYDDEYSRIAHRGYINGNWTSWSYAPTKDYVTPKTLYDNWSGTNGDVYLNETSANFNYIDIQFRGNEGENFVTSQRIYNPNGKYTTLLYSYVGDNNGYLYQKARVVYINGTSISTHATNRYSEATIKTSSASASKLNNVYITKVMGYR